MTETIYNKTHEERAYEMLCTVLGMKKTTKWTLGQIANDIAMVWENKYGDNRKQIKAYICKKYREEVGVKEG